MELKLPEKDILDQLLKIETSIETTYQEFERLYIDNQEEQLQKHILFFQEQSYIIEQYLLSNIVDKERGNLLFDYVNNKLQEKSLLSDLEAICIDEEDTRILRRLRRKLTLRIQAIEKEKVDDVLFNNLMSDLTDQEVEMLDNLTIQQKVIFKDLIEEFEGNNTLPIEVKKQLIRAKFSMIFLSDQELIYSRNLFKPINILDDFSINRINEQNIYQRKKQIWGMNMVNQQIGVLFGKKNQNIGTHHQLMGEVLLRQALLRTGLLFLEEEQVQEVATDFQNLIIKDNLDYANRTMAVNVISTAFCSYSKDRKGMTRQDLNPCLVR